MNRLRLCQSCNRPVLLITAVGQLTALKQQKMKLCRKWQPTELYWQCNAAFFWYLGCLSDSRTHSAVCACRYFAIWKRAILCVKLLRTFYRVYWSVSKVCNTAQGITQYEVTEEVILYAFANFNHSLSLIFAHNCICFHFCSRVQCLFS